MRAHRASELLLLVTLGCGNAAAAPEPAPELDRTAVQAELRSLFVAIDGSDCDALSALLPAIHSRADCDMLVHHLHEEGFRLREIRQIVVDGRDPHSAIVHTLVDQSGREREILVRATLSEGRWTFTL